MIFDQKAAVVGEIITYLEGEALRMSKLIVESETPDIEQVIIVTRAKTLLDVSDALKAGLETYIEEVLAQLGTE